MSNSFRPPDDIQIASMNKKQAAIRDPMAHGSGTPWEDRGSLGLAGAFFKTVGQSLFSPSKLLDSIRRPETFSDAKIFSLLCGAFWGTGLALQAYLWTRSESATLYNIDMTYYVIGMVLEFAGAVAFTLIGVKIFSSLFLKMIATDLKGRNAPPSLMQNLTSYMLGPSVIAIIPIVGPAIAGVWIFFNLIVVGLKRLQLGFASTFIAVLLSSIVISVLGVALHFVGWFALNYFLDVYSTIKAGNTFLPT